jgi:hypothetical protein
VEAGFEDMTTEQAHITTIAVAWTVMAFRAETPAIVQAFNDLGFFLFLHTWPPFGIRSSRLQRRSRVLGRRGRLLRVDVGRDDESHRPGRATAAA